jgi:hypothetical protein
MSPSWNSDPTAERKQELSQEHDGSPIYVSGRPFYLVGGAIIEDIIDVPGWGPAHIRFEMFHRNGQAYLKGVPLDHGIRCDAFIRVTDLLVSALAADMLESKK